MSGLDTKLVRAEGSRDLIIAFSGRGVPAGRYQPYRQVLAIGANALFFNCRHDDWYQAEMDAIRDEIARIVARLRPERILYYGFSMGAHPALILGSQHDGARVLALSGEVEVGRWGTLSEHLPSHGHYSHVGRFLAARTSGTLTLVYGIQSAIEAANSIAIRDLGADVRFLPCGHYTEVWLHDHGRLLCTLRAALEDEPIAITNAPPPELALMYPLLGALFHRNGIDFLEGWQGIGRDNAAWMELVGRWHTIRSRNADAARDAFRCAYAALRARDYGPLCLDIPHARTSLKAHILNLRRHEKHWRASGLASHILADRAARRTAAGSHATEAAAVQDRVRDSDAGGLNIEVAGRVGNRGRRRNQGVVGAAVIALMDTAPAVGVGIDGAEGTLGA